MAGDNIVVPAVWFYIICCVLFFLIGVVVFMWILLKRMKSKLYGQLKDPNESIITTKNSNKFNIQLHNRKESDRLLRMYDDFKFDESTSASTNNLSTENKLETKDQIDNVNEEVKINKDLKIKETVLPPLLLRQQMEQICSELLNSRNKFKPIKGDNAEESYELKAVNNIKNRMKSIRGSLPVRSKSTTDLNIYDNLPETKQVFNFSTAANEDEKYSTPRNGGVVIVNDESGYLLPLSFKITYANASTE